MSKDTPNNSNQKTEMNPNFDDKKYIESFFGPCRKTHNLCNSEMNRLLNTCRDCGHTNENKDYMCEDCYSIINKYNTLSDDEKDSLKQKKDDTKKEKKEKKEKRNILYKTCSHCDHINEKKYMCHKCFSFDNECFTFKFKCKICGNYDKNNYKKEDQIFNCTKCGNDKSDSWRNYLSRWFTEIKKKEENIWLTERKQSPLFCEVEHVISGWEKYFDPKIISGRPKNKKFGCVDSFTFKDCEIIKKGEVWKKKVVGRDSVNLYGRLIPLKESSYMGYSVDPDGSNRCHGRTRCKVLPYRKRKNMKYISIKKENNKFFISVPCVKNYNIKNKFLSVIAVDLGRSDDNHFTLWDGEKIWNIGNINSSLSKMDVDIKKLKSSISKKEEIMDMKHICNIIEDGDGKNYNDIKKDIYKKDIWLKLLLDRMIKFGYLILKDGKYIVTDDGKKYTKTRGKRLEREKSSLSKLEFKRKNIRKDFINKITTFIADYDIVVMESSNDNIGLDVDSLLNSNKKSFKKGNIKSYHDKNKKQLDACFGKIGNLISSKVKEKGGICVGVDQWSFPTTQTCSGCGKINKMNLSDGTYLQEYNCDCGISLGRNENSCHCLFLAGDYIRKQIMIRGSLPLRITDGFMEIPILGKNRKIICATPPTMLVEDKPKGLDESIETLSFSSPPVCERFVGNTSKLEPLANLASMVRETPISDLSATKTTLEQEPLANHTGEVYKAIGKGDEKEGD